MNVITIVWTHVDDTTIETALLRVAHDKHVKLFKLNANLILRMKNNDIQISV